MSEMAHAHDNVGYRIYWVTWGILLALTAVMLLTEMFQFSRPFVIAVLLVAMIIKASLIGGQFMHLRYEKLALVLAVVGSIAFLSAYLFILISFDGMRIFHMPHP